MLGDVAMLFVFVDVMRVEKVQRMIDLQDDCPHPGCAGLDSTQHLRVREADER